MFSQYKIWHFLFLLEIIFKWMRTWFHATLLHHFLIVLSPRLVGLIEDKAGFLSHLNRDLFGSKQKGSG